MQNSRKFIGQVWLNGSNSPNRRNVVGLCPPVLATYKHGSHLTWSLGTQLKISFEGKESDAVVSYIHPSLDFVLLIAQNPASVSFPSVHESIGLGQPYALLSSNADKECPLGANDVLW
jgi:hypothetical protein